MKYCPTCGEKYQNSMRFCLADGTALPNADVDAETLRMDKTAKEPPEVTYILKKEVVEKGDYVDFVLPNFTLRITVRDILEADLPSGRGIMPYNKELATHIIVDSATPITVCNGPQTERSAYNEFLVPAERDNLESRSLFFFYIGSERVVLFRLFVTHINIHSGRVELDLGYFRYKKPNAT